MIPKKVYNIMVDLLPMIILFSVVTIIVRVITLMYNHEKVVLYKELKNLLFTIYIFALFYLVTTSDFESYSNNFIPFKEIMRYDLSSVLFYRNVVGNIALFIPFGYLITDSIKERAGKINILITGLITALTSLTIEVIQMFVGRSFDIDDILLNFLGGLLGYGIYMIAHILYHKLIPKKYKNNTFKFFAFIFLIALFALLLFLLYFYKGGINL